MFITLVLNFSLYIKYLNEVVAKLSAQINDLYVNESLDKHIEKMD